MFRVEDVKPKASHQNKFEPLPPAVYDAQIESVELRDNRNNTGSFFKFRWRILGPSHTNRVIFSNVTWQHQNPKAQDIGRQNLAELCTALKRKGFDRPEDLANGTCKILVGIERSPQYGAQNTVKGYRPPESRSERQHRPQGGGRPLPPQPQPPRYDDSDVPF